MRCLLRIYDLTDIYDRKSKWRGIDEDIMKLKTEPLLEKDQSEILHTSAKLLWTELCPPKISMLKL